MNIKPYFRGFIAVKISRDVENAIRLYQESLRGEKFECRWVKPGNIHLTLNFLGNVENSAAFSIADSLKESLKGFRPFEISILSVGVFPNARRPQVFWAGIDNGVEELKSIKNSVDDCIVDFGFKKEERDFRPHLTIGRFKGRVDSQALGEVIEKDRDKVFGKFETDHVVFFKSDLKPQGPEYSEVASIGFS